MADALPRAAAPHPIAVLAGPFPLHTLAAPGRHAAGLANLAAQAQTLGLLAAFSAEVLRPDAQLSAHDRARVLMLLAQAEHLALQLAGALLPAGGRNPVGALARQGGAA